MIAVSANITFGDDITGDFMRFMKAAPDLFNRKVPSAARRVSAFAKQEMPKATPGSPSRAYPFRWTPAKNQNRPPNTRWGYYSKQKAAFFATRGFGGGIPYSRTGGLMRSWRVETNLESGEGFFALINTSRVARYVIGSDQQRYHADIGWPKIEDTAAFQAVADFALEEIGKLHNSLVDDWLERFG